VLGCRTRCRAIHPAGIGRLSMLRHCSARRDSCRSSSPTPIRRCCTPGGSPAVNRGRAPPVRRSPSRPGGVFPFGLGRKPIGLVGLLRQVMNALASSQLILMTVRRNSSAGVRAHWGFFQVTRLWGFGSVLGMSTMLETIRFGLRRGGGKVIDQNTRRNVAFGQQASAVHTLRFGNMCCRSSASRRTARHGRCARWVGPRELGPSAFAGRHRIAGAQPADS
jgi:hypothetical protein